MRTLLHTEFVALLNRAGVSQAGFGRLAGVTARQVNNWAKGRAALPKWVALIAVMMEDYTPETLETAVEAADFSWSEVLGIPAGSDVSAVRKAMLRLASIYHPDKGGLSEQMVRVNAAYARALRTASITEPGDH